MKIFKILPLLLLANSGWGQVLFKKPDASAELLKVQRAWLDAYETNDAATMNRLVGNGFVLTFADGGQQTKTELMDLTKAKAGEPSGISFLTQDTKVSLYAKNVAVLRGILITRWQDPSGGAAKEQQQRYTDTYVKRNGRWQIVASQLTNLTPK
ncbi:MAG: nuclear transport factor 2 family protein [Saprospiraceae bacterium]